MSEVRNRPFIPIPIKVPFWCSGIVCLTKDIREELRVCLSMKEVRVDKVKLIGRGYENHLLQLAESIKISFGTFRV